MKYLTRVLSAGALVAGLVSTPAMAGRQCEQQALSVYQVVQSLSLAEKTHQSLTQSGADVVIIARAGQDLSKYGLQYSHLGFALKEIGSEGKPVWRVLHKLNACGSSESALYRQGLGEFYLDNLWQLQAAWVVPSVEVQQKLQLVLRNPALLSRLHERQYNLVSYPWSQQYQQSNQWAIETLAMAMGFGTAQTSYSADDAYLGLKTKRQIAQHWLMAHAYVPSTLRIGTLTRLGGRMGSANIAFDDHPTERRFAGLIDTVTVDSVFAWLQRSGMAGSVQRIGL